MAEFKHFDLKLVEPIFNSPLTDLIIELDYLRKKPLGGTTHPVIFFQLKDIFHTLESIGSARIEGNRTTLAEYIETKISQEEDIKRARELGARDYFIKSDTTLAEIVEKVKQALNV